MLNLLHFIGLAFGLGGATIAAIISRKAEKDKEISSAIMKIIPSISRLIWFALLLLIISGIALPYFISWPLNRQNLIIKHVLVAWIFIIGIFIGTRMRKMQKIGINDKSFVKYKKQIKILSTINIILWYAVVLLSAFV